MKEKIKRRELIKPQLIKSDVYRKTHDLKGITLEETTNRLKKSLKIIYLYHVNNKRLLFIGGSPEESKYLKRYFKRTKHVFVSRAKWINGVLNNRNLQLGGFDVSRPKVLSRDVRDIIKLRNQFDLVIITDEQLDTEALAENSKRKTPIISLNSNMSPFNTHADFKTPGNLTRPDNRNKTNFFYSLLQSTFRKAERLRKRCPYVTHKLKEIAAIEKKEKRFYRGKLRLVKKRRFYDRRPKWVKERSVDRDHTENVWLYGRELRHKIFRKDRPKKNTFTVLKKKSYKASVVQEPYIKKTPLSSQHKLGWAIFNRPNFKNPERTLTRRERLEAERFPKKGIFR